MGKMLFRLIIPIVLWGTACVLDWIMWPTFAGGAVFTLLILFMIAHMIIMVD